MKIGFIGAGVMGHGMAENLVKAGHELTLLANRNRAPIDDLVSKGATEAHDHRDLASRAEIIILCVTNADVVEAVVHSLLPHLNQGQIILDTSTSKPAVSRRLATELEAVGVKWAEAPLTGGAQQATEGVLGAIVGTDPQTYETIKPILECFCSRMALFGPAGAGHHAKLINNYLVFGMVAMITETYNMARAADIDWGDLFDVMKSGSNYSEALRRIVGSALEGNYDGYQFTIDGARKDMAYFLAEAEAGGDASAMAHSVMAVFEEAAQRGMGDRNVSRLIDPELA